MKTLLRNWLGIKDPIEPKDWTEDFKKLEDEMWKHRQIIGKERKSNCPVCKETIMLWPLEEEAYYTRDGKAYHIKCYDKRV